MTNRLRVSYVRNLRTEWRQCQFSNDNLDYHKYFKKLNRI